MRNKGIVPQFLLAVMLVISFQFEAASQETSEERINQILQQDNRPTMEEVRDVISDFKAPNGIPLDRNSAANLGYDERIDFKLWYDILISMAPKLIASLEYTFPGGTWVFMGRDGSAIADVLEVFYYSIGQTNRVVRLGVSKASFVNASNETLLNFLESHGFSLDNYRNEHPYILIDPVSRGFGRQGRSLLGAVYHIERQREKLPSDLLEKLNMFGLVVSTFGGLENNFTDKEQIFELERKRMSLDSTVSWDQRHFHENHKVITYPQQENYANEAGYTHFVGAWHESYGQIYQNDDGKYVARRGSPLGLEMRQSILWLQKKIWRAAKQEKFLDSVRSEAIALGYEFPMSRPAPVNIGGDIEEEAPDDTVAEEDLNQRLLRHDEFVKNIDSNSVDSSLILIQQKLLRLAPLKESDQRNENGISPNGTALAHTFREVLEKLGAPSNEILEAMKSKLVLEVFNNLANRLISPVYFNSDDLTHLFQTFLNESKLTTSTLEALYELKGQTPYLETFLMKSRSYSNPQKGLLELQVILKDPGGDECAAALTAKN